MGTLDFLKGVKGHIIDAATYDLLQRTYELQEENNHQLKEQVAFLKEKTDALTKENTSLADKVEKLSVLVRDDDFTISEGLAFRKGPDGKFAPEAYCPTCFVIMSDPFGPSLICQKCRYETRPNYYPSIIVERLNTPTPPEPPTHPEAETKPERKD